MSIYNYSDDLRHDLEIYEQEQEKMDKREEQLQQFVKSAERMYRTEELGALLCWYVESGRDSYLKGINKALENRDYEQAGMILNALIKTYAPILAREYAEKVLEQKEKEELK